jgi:hypothetical protein
MPCGLRTGPAKPVPGRPADVRPPVVRVAYGGHSSACGTACVRRHRSARAPAPAHQAQSTAHLAHRVGRSPRRRTPVAGSTEQLLPFLFSQLRMVLLPLANAMLNALRPCLARGMRSVDSLRKVGASHRRTSQRGQRVQRFVIECFTPSCHVDLLASGELVTLTTRDAVDSILAMTGGGTVQDRGETCRTERTRPPRGA